MSIYPVRLSHWFPPNEDEELFSIAYFLTTIDRCYACGKKVRWKGAVGHHSLPWGHGDLWCSWKCCKSKRVAKVDKRRQRRIARKFGEECAGIILLKQHDAEDEANNAYTQEHQS